MFSLDLNTETVSQLMTAGGREFQVAGAAQLKDRLPISVHLKGTSRNDDLRLCDMLSVTELGQGPILGKR